MRHHFYRPNLTVIIPARNPQVALLQLAGKIGGNPVAAVVTLFNTVAAIGARDQRIGPQFNVVRLFYQRAAKRRDNHPAFGIGFRMCGIPPAHNVARVFDNRVLESSAGAKEWNAVFPRVAYSDKRAFGVL